MANYDLIEKVGTSNTSYEEAITQALKTVKAEISWFEVTELRGGVINNKLEFQVKVKIGIKE